MIELNHQDRMLLTDDDTGFPLFKIVAAVVVIFALVGGLSYWYFAPQSAPQPPIFNDVYSRLGIAPLPPSVERQPEFQKRLSQLRREPCYVDAILGLSDELFHADYPCESATSVQTFAKRCDNLANVSILYYAYRGLTQVSDFSGALPIVNQMVEADPAVAQYRVWRGATYEKLKNYSSALSDYIAGLQLLGNPRRVPAQQFYYISQMYAALGRYCDAIAPIETFISFNSAENRTPQLMKVIADYADKGRCDTKYARGAARVPLLGATGVHTLTVVVNGVSGNFILDTGATYVAATTDFSAKANINIEAASQLPMKTVGGAVVADLGYATTISVGKAEAQGVAVAVVRGTTDPFGGRLDGLLGMSYLARFNVKLLQDVIELSSIPLR
jgi:tetratricopeptide (TPR) repeat protein